MTYLLDKGLYLDYIKCQLILLDGHSESVRSLREFHNLPNGELSEELYIGARERLLSQVGSLIDEVNELRTKREESLNQIQTSIEPVSIPLSKEEEKTITDHLSERIERLFAEALDGILAECAPVMDGKALRKIHTHLKTLSDIRDNYIK